jgi:hypothetical protein
MAPKIRPPTHPGEILLKDFLEPLGLSQKQFAGEHGTQLLWSYARSCEYIENDPTRLSNKSILLFDNRDEKDGEIIDVNKYALRDITIFIDTGELILRKVASLTRWELMESSPESSLMITTEDPYSITQLKPVQSPILYKFLQSQLQKNPLADRIIIQAVILREIKKVSEKRNTQ